MVNLTKIGKVIFYIIILVYVVPTITDFLEIDYSVYGIYVVWFVALGVLFFFLPSQHETIFTRNKFTL